MVCVEMGDLNRKVNPPSNFIIAESRLSIYVITGICFYGFQKILENPPEVVIAHT